MAGLGFVTAVLISLLVCILVWAGILFQYGTAVIQTIRLSHIDLMPPTSLREIIAGLILGMFLSLAVSVFVTPFFILARKSWAQRNEATDARAVLKSPNSYRFLPTVLICTFLAISAGGLLVFLVPAWIGGFALALGTGIVFIATKRP